MRRNGDQSINVNDTISMIDTIEVGEKEEPMDIDAHSEIYKKENRDRSNYKQVLM